MDLELKGKVAIVTGGSRGIGKAIARELAREGVNVALAARDAAALKAAAEEIGAETGSQVLGFKAETGDDASVKALVADVIAAFGQIDILVNCAAVAGSQQKPPVLAEVTAEGFWGDFNVKVMGYIRTAREVAPHMKQRRSGRIINISGTAARNTGTITGSIRNVGVVAMTKNLADELAPFGISAVCVHPGTTRTEKTAGVIERRAKAEGVSTEEVEKKMGRANLAGRMISAQEIGYVVTFLASPKSASINGDVISVAGGVPGPIYY